MTLNTAALLRTISRKVDQGLGAAADEYADEMRTQLSTPGPAPSRPGQPPHRQSGDLVDAVDTDKGKGEARAGIMDAGQLPKAISLATGYGNRAPRPYVPPTRARADRAALRAFVKEAKL